MKKYNFLQSPYLFFSPFLVIFIVWVFLFHSDGTWGDEAQYLTLARNLIHGFYSPPAPEINIPVGPGYPLILTPFVAFNLPLISIALLNAFLYYLSIVLLFKSLRRVVTFPLALGFSLYWALYYNAYRELKMIVQPEILTSFLISLLTYWLLISYDKNISVKSQHRYLYASGFVLGFLVLTKIIFGYVLIFLTLGMFIILLINGKNKNYRKGFVLLLIAFTIQLPYLFYTYSLTGKVFYWGTTGGTNLYWMSNPNTGEYGDWWTLTEKYNPLAEMNPNYYESLRANHIKDWEEYNKYNYYSHIQDSLFKSIAIKNIKSNPIKFIQNCFSNVGRILFDYPYSYRLQDYKDLLRLPHNGIIIVIALFCLIPTLINWRKLIFPIRFMLLLVLLYLGGSVLGSASLRMFTKIVPVILFWMAFILQKSVKVCWKYDSEDVY